jgi:hypothetical protein
MFLFIKKINQKSPINQGANSSSFPPSAWQIANSVVTQGGRKRKAKKKIWASKVIPFVEWELSVVNYLSIFSLRMVNSLDSSPEELFTGWHQYLYLPAITYVIYASRSIWQTNENFHSSHNRKYFLFPFVFGPHEILVEKTSEKNQSMTAVSWKRNIISHMNLFELVVWK